MKGLLSSLLVVLLFLAGCGGGASNTNLCPKSLEEKAEARKTIRDLGYDFNKSDFLRHIEKGNNDVIEKYWEAGIAEKDKIYFELIDSSEEIDKDILFNLLSQAKICGADVNEKNEAGWAPLHFVSRSGDYDIVQFLIENGADVNLKGNFLITSLHFAAGLGHDDIVKILIENGANVNAEADNGMTPLSAASSNKAPDDNEEIVEYLKKHGASE